MGNIVLTEGCNLRCPYCFANEFVDGRTDEISIENFLRAVNFVLSDSRGRVGLIGGEPLVWTHFAEGAGRLIKDKRVKLIVLYTNGVFADKYYDIITDKKFSLLINCNSPKNMGDVMYNRMAENIDTMINKYDMKNRITLGINMYSPDFEYDYLIEMLAKYKFERVRISITVPNFDSSRNMNALPYFESMKSRLKEFMHAALDVCTEPRFDCNAFPYCRWTSEDSKEFAVYYKKGVNRMEQQMKSVECVPVIDILPDLTAIRCFGLSQYTKVNISDFDNITDLRRYYSNMYDSYAFTTASCKECSECYRRQTMKCNGGCLAYKISDILKLRDMSEALMHN